MRKLLTTFYFFLFTALATPCIAFAIALLIRGTRWAWNLGWTIFLVLAVTAHATPILFTTVSLTGSVNNRSILITPDAKDTPLNYGTNLVSLIPFTVQPVGGQVITNLTPWGYTIKVDGWPRSAHITVPDSTNILNAAPLINTNQFSPLNIITMPPVATGTGLTSTIVNNTNNIAVDFTQVVNQPSFAAWSNTVPTYNGNNLGFNLTAPDGSTLLTDVDRRFLNTGNNYPALTNAPRLDVRNFGARVDGQTIYNTLYLTNAHSAGICLTSNSAVVVVTNWYFSPADIGKNVEVCFAGFQTNVATKILSVQTTNQITLSSVIPFSNVCVNIDYGHDDTPAVQAAINYIATNLLNGNIFIPNNGYACFLDGPWKTNYASATNGSATEFYSILTLPPVGDYQNTIAVGFVGDSVTPTDEVSGSRFLCSRSPDKTITMFGYGCKDYFGNPFNWRCPFTIIGAPYGYNFNNGVNTGGFNLVKLWFDQISFETYLQCSYDALNMSFIGSLGYGNLRSGVNWPAAIFIDGTWYWNLGTYFSFNPSGGAGLILPLQWNHVDIAGQNYCGVGYKYCLIVAEDAALQKVTGYGAQVAVMQIAANHISSIQHLYVYGAQYTYVAATNTVDGGNQTCQIMIQAADVENSNWRFIHDPGNLGRGFIGYYFDYNGYTDAALSANIGGENITTYDISKGVFNHLAIGNSVTNFTLRITNNAIAFSTPGMTNFASIGTNGFVGNGAGLSNVTATLPSNTTQFGTNVMTGVYSVGSNSPTLTTNTSGVIIHVPIFGYDYYEFPSPTGAINELGNSLWSIGPGTNQVNYSYAIPLTMFYGKTNFIFTLTLCTTNSSWIALRMQNMWFRRDAASPVFYSDGNRISEYESFITPTGTNTFDVVLTNALQQGTFAWPINSTNINAAYIGVLNYTNTVTYRIVRATLKSYPQ